MSLPQQSLDTRPGHLHRAVRPAKPCDCGRSWRDAEAYKTGSKLPTERWVLRCDCGRIQFCGGM